VKTSVSGMNEGVDSTLASAISKVKRHVLPLFVIMFIVNYIDRVNIGFVRTHMEHDLGIGAAAYGFGAGLFFIGYALFEVPSNMLLQKVGARIWLTRIMFTWGVVATCMAFIQNETHFYILRFLLGVAEAGFFPGVIYYFTRWLPGAERGKAIAIFLSGSAIASLISGPLSGLLLQINGLGMHGWQWMYFIEGMFSVCLCVFVWFWLDAKPHDAKWLSRAEQDALVTAIDDEQKAREAATPIRPSMGKLLKDRQIILLPDLLLHSVDDLRRDLLAAEHHQEDGRTQRCAGRLVQLDSVVAVDCRHVRLRLPLHQMETPAGMGRRCAVDRCSGNVHVHHGWADLRLRRDLLCGAGFQVGFVAVLADTAGVSGCANCRRRDRADQLGGQPWRFRCADHFRTARRTHRLDSGWPLRLGRYLDHCRDHRLLRPHQA
jgi:hypothetical protein